LNGCAKHLCKDSGETLLGTDSQIATKTYN
jgi:hypothetical protein